MKKRIFSMALALVMLLALAVPALAAEEPEPEYRLVKVVNNYQGSEFTLAYGQGGYLPTEVLRNGAPYVTASYDENGNLATYTSDGQEITGASSFAHTYDEDGNYIRKDENYSSSDGFHFDSVTEYTYDEDGNCVREEDTTDYGDGDVATRVTEYTYDEAGNCVREEYTRTKSDGAKSTEVTEYTYDEEGRVLSEVTTDNSGETDEMTYTYSEDGRCTRTDGNGNTRIEYEVPLLDVTWQELTLDNSDGTSHTIDQCDLMLLDNAEYVDILYAYCTCDGEPTLTYDDNGYLVRVDGAEGNSIELTYEPVA